MSDLLTQEEYQAIADSMSFPANAYINGKYMAAKSGKTFETVNPATGAVLANIADCGAEDVDYAVKKARQTFERGEWSKLHPRERKRTLIKFTKLIQRNRHELAVLESIDSGKPISDCANLDLPETIDCFAWYAEAADKMYQQMSPTTDDAMGLIVREPMGVVACVLPWNFPMLMLAWKVAPALAAGNSVIVKPAPTTSMTALRLAELAAEAGVPAGALNVLAGGAEVGEAIGLHPDINAMAFTGSTAVGRKLLEYSAKSNLKRINLELGGKSASVVFSDAEHLDSVAANVVYGAFWNMGENCTANSRLIVNRAIKADLLARIQDKLRGWPTGYPLDPSNALGAMTTKLHFDKVMKYIKLGKKEGATLILGGEPLKIGDGLYIPPTIFDDVTPDMTIAREEIFGPVLTILTVDNDEEAILLANDSEYGLQGSIYTANGTKALRMARELQAGTVSINCYSEGDITTPFGGYKLSGLSGRDNSLQAFEQYTQTKTIWIDLSDRPLDETLD
ncbi:aldehyde dehydrogenase [Pontiella sp.]|uniref:aldehyde dehydrogenase n=1 Tax=Pontiella sp. TaxID=2837462 RepID=UPI00356851F2